MTCKLFHSGRRAGILGFALPGLLCGGMVFGAQPIMTSSAPPQTAEQVDSGNKLEAGKRLFEKVIEAHGGRKRLSEIRETTFRADYRIYPPGIDMTAVYYTKLPDRFRIDMVLQGGARFGKRKSPDHDYRRRRGAACRRCRRTSAS